LSDPASLLDETGRVVVERCERAERIGERTRGLLGRDGLEPGTGLWIARTGSVHTFFMRFPMDAVFLDEQLRVRKIVPAVKPFRVAWSRGARSVVELAAGEADRVGLVEGMQLSWHDQTHVGG
jgi:uncharacterized membrane protein (UPF0127 family)